MRKHFTSKSAPLSVNMTEPVIIPRLENTNFSYTTQTKSEIQVGFRVEVRLGVRVGAGM